MTLTDKEVTAISLKFFGVHNFARAIEARVLEELRKQEPFCYLKEEWLHYEQSAEGLPHAFPVYAAPIPSTRIKDFSELRDELDAAPIPPTPSQEEALDAKRWRYYADCPQTALMLGTELDPNSEQDWAAECSRLVDASLARPDTEGNGK